MKRKLSVLLALLLAFVMVLSACGGKTEEPAKKDDAKTEESKDAEKKDGEKAAEATPLKGEITVQAEETWEAFYKEAADRIMKENPEAKINLKVIGSFDHVDVITNTDAGNKDVADLFALPSDRFTGLLENDVLAPINAQAIADKATGFKSLDDSMAALFKDGEDYFAFPFNIETLFAYVNVNNAKAAGIDLEKTTFDLAKQTDEKQVLIPLPDAWYAVAVNNSVGMNLLTKAEDGKLTSDYTTEYDKLDAEKKAMFDGLFTYWKLHNDKGTTLMGDADARNAYVTDTFKDGAGGVIRLDGPWAAEGLRADIEKGSIDVYPISKLTMNDKPLVHWQGGWALAVNSRLEGDADKMALAEAFIAELLKPENAPKLYLATGKILENADLSVYEGSKDLTDFDKKLIKTCLESYNTSVGRPLFTEYGQVWATWENSIKSLANSKPADAKAAYGEVKAAFDSMMQNFQ